MKYLLDTDILIDLIKKKNKIEEKVKDVGLVNCYVSEITIAELNFGAYHSGKINKHRDESEHISNTFDVIPISEILD
ncbi:VapC toxin family PIN domain ribonuclease, partial [Lewinellaceae bacterium SD302]